DKRAKALQEAEEIRQKEIRLRVIQQEKERKEAASATRETAGIIGKWEEVVDTNSSGYYSSFYRPSKVEEPQMMDIQLNIDQPLVKLNPIALSAVSPRTVPPVQPPQPKKKKKEDDSDDDDVISDSTINSLGSSVVGLEK